MKSKKWKWVNFKINEFGLSPSPKLFGKYTSVGYFVVYYFELVVDSSTDFKEPRDKKRIVMRKWTIAQYTPSNRDCFRETDDNHERHETHLRDCAIAVTRRAQNYFKKLISQII